VEIAATAQVSNDYGAVAYQWVHLPDEKRQCKWRPIAEPNYFDRAERGVRVALAARQATEAGLAKALQQDGETTP
jgi:hypothetical protein